MMAKLIARILYNLSTFILSLLLGPFFLFSKRGRKHLLQRYGIWSISSEEAAKPITWFHGASMGEMNGLIPIIREYRKHFPNQQILATATSPTGLERVRGEVDLVRLLPFDSLVWLSLATRNLKIKQFIFAETELWPGLIDCVFRKQIPLFLVNARISDYSFEHYKKLKPFLSGGLKKLNGIFTSEQRSKDRYEELGADPQKVLVYGNAKYDSLPSITSKQQAQQLRARMCEADGPVVILASLRPGEEGFWFPEVAKFLSRGLQVIVAPRHSEKFDFFADALRKYRIEFSRWSEIKTSTNMVRNNKVLLLDTMGELESSFSFADVVFVGATLVDLGGHNPLEPAAYGACVCVGPYTSNAADVIQAMDSVQALIRVKDSNEIHTLLERIEQKDTELVEVGNRGFQLWKQNAGASARIVAKLKEGLLD